MQNITQNNEERHLLSTDKQLRLTLSKMKVLATRKSLQLRSICSPKSYLLRKGQSFTELHAESDLEALKSFKTNLYLFGILPDTKGEGEGIQGNRKRMKGFKDHDKVKHQQTVSSFTKMLHFGYY